MKFELTEKEQEARKRVCLALDVSTVWEAGKLASELSDVVGMFKVGKELHTAAGNKSADIVGKIYHSSKDMTGNVFLDLKYHDTPNTVFKASMEASKKNGVYMFNTHIAGGEAMNKKALEGAYEGSQTHNAPVTPKVIGVTVLTSLDDDDLKAQNLGISYDDLVRRRTELAREWGLDGIVCPASKVGALEKEFGSDFIYVTPGIKWEGIQNVGQKQLYTPDKAVQDCSSSILVIGSAITKAENKRETAYQIIQAMAKEL